MVIICFKIFLVWMLRGCVWILALARAKRRIFGIKFEKPKCLVLGECRSVHDYYFVLVKPEVFSLDDYEATIVDFTQLAITHFVKNQIVVDKNLAQMSYEIQHELSLPRKL